MDEIWARIEAWLDKNAPRALASLRSPADELDVAKFERKLGATLPDDFRASLRRHNGQFPTFAVFGRWELLDLQRLSELWLLNQEVLAISFCARNSSTSVSQSDT